MLPPLDVILVVVDIDGMGDIDCGSCENCLLRPETTAKLFIRCNSRSTLRGGFCVLVVEVEVEDIDVFFHLVDGLFEWSIGCCCEEVSIVDIMLGKKEKENVR